MRKDKINNFWKWIGLILITPLYLFLFIIIGTNKMMIEFFGETLSFLIIAILLPIILYLFFILILISFKDKSILIFGIIGSIIGIFYGFFFISGFAFDNFRYLLSPVYSTINYFVELVIGGPCHECWGLLFIYPGIFTFLFTLIGAIIGCIISKKRK